MRILLYQLADLTLVLNHQFDLAPQHTHLVGHNSHQIEPDLLLALVEAAQTLLYDILEFTRPICIVGLGVLGCDARQDLSQSVRCEWLAIEEMLVLYVFFEETVRVQVVI